MKKRLSYSFTLFALLLFIGNSQLVVGQDCGLFETGLCYDNDDGAGEILLTYCPDNPTDISEIFIYQVELSGGDELIIYEGDDDTGPVLGTLAGTGGTAAVTPFVDESFMATTPGACITLDFVSNGSVSCFDPFTAFGTEIEVTTMSVELVCSCPEPEVSFTMDQFELCSNTGANTNVEFTIDVATGDGLVFDWDFDGDGTIDLNTTDLTAEYTYPEGIGTGYIATLIATEGDCSTEVQNVVLVSAPPDDWLIISPTTPVCIGEVFTLNSVVNGGGFSWAPEVIIEQEITNESYFVFQELEVDNPWADDEVSCAGDIKVTLDIAHQWVGDIGIWLMCPDGEIVTLHEPNTPSGEVDETAFLDGQATPTTPSGGGSILPENGNLQGDYTFYSSFSGNGDVLDDYTTGEGNIPQGEYEASESLANFNGCPINGTWTLIIQDFWPCGQFGDLPPCNTGVDGFPVSVDSWSLEFGSCDFGFTVNEATSATWEFDGDPIGDTQGPITFIDAPADAGEYIYTPTYSDVFGCIYVGDPVTVEVLGPEDITFTVDNAGPFCFGEDIEFDVDVDNVFFDDVVTFDWEGPGGYTSSETNTNSQPDTPTDATEGGTYLLTVTLNDCQSVTLETEVVVYEEVDISVSGGGDYCPDAEITLLGTTNYSGDVTYAWTGPDDFESDVSEPTVTEAGTYTLVITSEDGCDSVAEDAVVTILDADDPVCFSCPPQADITFSWDVENLGSLCEGGVVITQVDVSDLSGSTIEYSWTGPDNFTSDEIIPIGLGIVPGEYCLELLVDDCPSSPQCLTVEFNELPEPIFDDPILEVCLADVFGYTLEEDYETYDWSTDGFINAGGGNDENFIEVEWDDLAGGPIAVEVTDANGCVGFVEIDITVLGANDPQCFSCPPAAAIDLTVDEVGPFCADEAILLNSSTGEDVMTYSWTGPGGFTSDEADPEGTVAGEYCLTITTVDDCDSAPVCTDVVVNALPEPTLDNPTLSLCLDEIATYTLENTYDSYAWTVDGGAINGADDEASIEVQWDDAAGGTISVTVDVEGCEGSSGDSEVTILDPLDPQCFSCPPAADIDLTVDNVGPFCADEAILLNSSTGEDVMTYSWTGPEGFTSDEADPEGTVAGEYCLTITTVDDCDSAPVCTDVVVNPLPQPVLDNPNLSPCLNETITYTLEGNYDTYFWTADGGTIDGADDEATVTVLWDDAAGGSISVLVSEASCEANTGNFEISLDSPECLCPVVNMQADVFLNDICGSGTVDLSTFFDDADISNSGNIDETLWFSDAGLNNLVDDFDVAHSGLLNNCDSETIIFYGAINCTTDATPILVGQAQVIIYPDLSEAVITISDDNTCAPFVSAYTCEGDDDYLLENNFDAGGATPDLSSETGAFPIEFSLTTPLGSGDCGSFVTQGNFSCINCPTTNDADQSVNICVSETFDIATVAAGINLNDGNGNNVQFFVGIDPASEEYTGQPLDSFVPTDICGATEFPLYAFILCDDDGDAGTPDIWVDLVYTLTLNVYPSDLPNVTVDGTCTVVPVIPAACTDFISVEPAEFVFNPGDNSTTDGQLSFTFTPNYPNDMIGVCAEPLVFDFEYDCPANCPTDLTANADLDVCSGQTFNLSATVTGGDSDVTYSWTGTDGLVSAEEMPEASVTNNSCEPLEITYTVTATCEDTGDDISLGDNEVTVRVYPSNFSFLSTTGEGTCETSVQFDAACVGLVNITPSATQTADAGTSPDHEYTITYNAPGGLSCMGDTTITIATDCPLGCLTSVDNPTSGTTTACDGGSFTENLQLIQDGITTDLDESAVFTWTDPDGNAIAADLSAVSWAHSGTTCNPETYVFTLEVGCNADPSVSINGGTHTVILYPEVQADWYTIPESEGCLAVVSDNCTSGSLEIQYSLNGIDFSLNPPVLTPGETVIITTEIEVLDAPGGCSITETYTINCPLAECPSSDFTPGPAENICDGGIPTLPPVNISDPDGTQLGTDIVWYRGANPDSPIYNGDAIAFNGSDACSAGPEILLTAWIECDNDGDGLPDEPIQVAEHTVVVYPAPQSPSVGSAEVDPVTGECNFVFVPACDNDVITPANVTTSPGAEAGTQAVTVASGIPGNPCSDEPFTLDYASCPSVDCFGTDFGSPALEILCSGETPSQWPEWNVDFSLTGNESTVAGDLIWFTSTNPIGSNGFLPEPVIQTGCEAGEIMTIYAFIACDTDGDEVIDDYIQVATHTFQAYPEVQAPTSSTMVEADGTCTHTFTPACPSDVLSDNTFSSNPGDAASTIDITVTSGLAGSPCPSEEFEVAYEECPSADCFISSFGAAITEDLCSGDTPTLPQEGLDFNIADIGNTLVSGIVWYEGTNPDVDAVYTPVPVDQTGCDVGPLTTVYAYAQCDGGSGVLEWIQVASHNFQVYPAPESPTIDVPGTDPTGTCFYLVSPACPDDVLDPFDFDLPPGSAAGTLTISVSNPNNPSCPSPVVFDVPYTECPSADCFGSDFGTASIEPLCSGDTPSQFPELGVDFNLTDNITTQLDGVVWYEGTNPDVDAVYTPLPVDQTGCEAGAVTTVYAYIACDTNGDSAVDNWIQVASHSFQAYPEVTTPSTNMVPAADGTCNYTVVPACPTDELSPETFSFSPGEVASTIDVTVTSGLVGNPCLADVAFQVAYIECPSAACFSSDFGTATTENLCSGDTPSQFPELGVDFNITDLGNTQLDGVVWYEGTNLDVDAVYTPVPVDQTGCEAGAVTTVYAYIACDTNGDSAVDNWIQVASHSFQAYPAAQEPTLNASTVGPNGDCVYTITAACPGDDLLSTDEFSVVLGAPAGDQSITVTPLDGICPEMVFDLSYAACSADCPTALVGDAIGENLEACEGDFIDLFTPQNTVSTDLDGSAMYTWTDQNGSVIGTPLDNVPVTHPGTCQVETMTYTLTIGCTGDAAVAIDGGTVTVNVYPTISGTMYSSPDPGTCIVELTDLCTQGSLEIMYSETGVDGSFEDTPPPPPAPGQTNAIVYLINVAGAPEQCGTQFSTTVSCAAIDCLTSDFNFGNSTPENLCDGGTPTMLPEEDTDYTITDDGSTQVGDVVWYTGNDPNVDFLYNGGAFSHSGTDNCAADGVLNLFAFTQCDNGTDTTWVQVAQHSIIVYPAIQEPILVGPTVDPDSGDCTYTINPACPGDILNVPGFTLSPSSIAGMQAVEVIGGILGSPCPSPETFNLDYDACPSAGCVGTDFDFIGAIPELLCSGDTPTLPSYNLTGDIGTAIAGTEAWYEGDPEFGIQFTPGSVDHTGDICAPDAIVTVNAYVECDNGTGNEWILLASHTYQVFPEVQEPTLSLSVDDDGNCTYTVDPECPTDTPSVTEVVLGSGDPGGTLDGTISSGIPNNPCGDVAFSLDYDECADVVCPIDDTATNEPTDALCDGESLDLTTLESAGIVAGVWTVEDNTGAPVTLNGTTFESTGLDAGDYTAIYTPIDAVPTSCPENSTETITVAATPIPVADNDGPACEGEDIELTAETIPGATYAWAGPNTFTSDDQNVTLTAVTAAQDGEYILEVTVDGCSATTTTNVTVNPSANLSISPAAPAICGGSPVTLTVSGFPVGADLEWDNASADTDDVITVMPDVTTTYTVTATGLACGDATASVTVDVTGELDITEDFSAPAYCDGGDPYYIIMSGATQYDLVGFNGTWDAVTADSLLITSTDGTPFDIVGSDGGDCADTLFSIAIPLSDELVVSFDANIEEFGDCASGTLDAQIEGGTGAYTITWVPEDGLTDATSGTTDVDIDDPATYTITVTDELGCTASASIDVNPLPLPDVEVVGFPDDEIVLCPGQSIQVTLAGADTYEWLDAVDHPGGDQSVADFDNVTQSDSYDIVGTDEYGCEGETLTLNIIVDADFDVTTITDDEATICTDGSLELFVEDPPPGVTYDYLWNGPDLVDVNLANPVVTTAGMYEVVVSNAAGCSTTEIVNVSLSPSAMAAAGQGDEICQDEPITLSEAVVGTDNDVIWSGGTGSFDNVNAINPTYTPGVGESGQVELTMTASNDCGPVSSALTIDIVDPPALLWSDGGPIPSSIDACEGHPVDLPVTVDGVATIQWSGGNGSFEADTLANTNYLTEVGETSTDLSISADGVCDITQTIALNILPTTEIETMEPVTINQGETISLEIINGDSTANYVWTAEEGGNLSCEECFSPEATPETTTIYAVDNMDDCSEVANIMVTVLTDAIFLIPDAFTPNFDGQNDMFRPMGSSYELNNFEVYNRLGLLLYKGVGPGAGWDGTYNGEVQEVGVYMYIVEYTSLIDGVRDIKAGNVTLIR